MEIGLIILAVAVVAAAAIFAFARPKAAPEAIPEIRADPRLDTVIAGQGAAIDLVGDHLAGKNDIGHQGGERTRCSLAALLLQQEVSHGNSMIRHVVPLLDARGFSPSVVCSEVLADPAMEMQCITEVELD